MPSPLSVNASSAYSPSGKALSAVTRTFWLRMTKRPPRGIASRAFTAILMIANSSSVASARTCHMSGDTCTFTWTFSPAAVSINPAAAGSQTARSIGSCLSGCLRATLSKRRASASAPAVARSTAKISRSSPLKFLRRASSIFAATTISKLLKSCATLATRLPSAPMRRNCRLDASAESRMATSACQRSHAACCARNWRSENNTSTQTATHGAAVITAISE